MPRYEETGEPMFWVTVFNDAHQAQSERILCTWKQMEDLEAQLPLGWSFEFEDWTKE